MKLRGVQTDINSDKLVLCKAAKGKKRRQLGRSPQHVTVSGVDVLVYLTGPYQKPVEQLMTKKLTAVELMETYGRDGIVFLQNKNLQNIPRKFQGSIIWVACLEIIGKITFVKGHVATVVVLFPNNRKGDQVEAFDLRLKGAYLEQILGAPVDSFNQFFRKKEVFEASNLVKTPVDSSGCIKMSIHGPDICNVTWEERYSGAKKMKMSMLPVRDEWTSLNTAPIPKEKEEKSVPVVYVFCHDASRYTYVEKHVEDLFVEDGGNEEFTNGRIQLKPVVGVPLGSAQSSGSKW